MHISTKGGIGVPKTTNINELVATIISLADEFTEEEISDIADAVIRALDRMTRELEEKLDELRQKCAS